MCPGGNGFGFASCFGAGSSVVTRAGEGTPPILRSTGEEIVGPGHSRTSDKLIPILMLSKPIRWMRFCRGR